MGARKVEQQVSEDNCKAARKGEEGVSEDDELVSDEEVRRLAAEDVKAARERAMAKKLSESEELEEDNEEQRLSLKKRKRSSSRQRAGVPLKTSRLSTDIVVVIENQPLAIQTLAPKKENPEKIVKLVNKLTDKKKELVEEIGFGAISRIKFDAFSKELCRLLVLKFSTVNRYIEVGQDKMCNTSDNVYDVLGLPIEGVEVSEVNRAGIEVNPDDSVQLIWKNEFGVNKNGDIPSKMLLDRITDEDCLGADFKKYFVMYVVSSFLNPQARSLVDLKLVDALEDVDMIPKYDWCRLWRVSKATTTLLCCSLNGCLVIPLMVFLHQYPLLGEELPCSVPLIANWETKKLVYVWNEVLKEGIEGMLKSSQSFPLTCKGKPLDSGVSLGVRPISSCSVIQPLTSDVVSFRIPEGMLTDRQIWSVAKGNVLRALSLSLQFHMNIEIIARVYLAEIQEHFFSGKMASQDEVVAMESKKVFIDPNLMKGV